MKGQMTYWCSECEIGTNNKNDIHQYFKVYVVVHQCGISLQCKKCDNFIFLGKVE